VSLSEAALSQTFGNRHGLTSMRTLTPYLPGRKTYAPLSPDLRAQWEAIAPSHSQNLEYRPCSATLKSGEVIPCVYVCDAQAYISIWGVWPEDDHGKQHIRVEDIAAIAESALRLPVVFANELYRAGESGMGYSVFTVVFSDGAEVSYVSGNALDFVSLPNGKRMADIVRVLPHKGRDQHPLGGLKYHWCLFGSGEGRNAGSRFANGPPGNGRT
jgi:hypothetical protein